MQAPHAARHAFRTRTCAIVFMSADLLMAAFPVPNDAFPTRTTDRRRRQWARRPASLSNPASHPTKGYRLIAQQHQAKSLRVPMSSCCAQAWLAGCVCRDQGGVQVRALPVHVVTKRVNTYLGPLVPGRGRTAPGIVSRRASSCCLCAADGEGRQPGTSATDEVSN